MNTATAVIRITAAASAVALGVALAGCQGTRSEKTSESAKTSASSAVSDDLSPMQARQMKELLRLPVSTVDDDLSPAGSGRAPAASPSPVDRDVVAVDIVEDDLSPLGGR